MKWISDYDNLLEKDKLVFKNCINQLMSQSFLVYKKGSDKLYYRFSERHFDIIREYLLMSGWELYQNVDDGLIYVKHQLGKNKRNLTLGETLFLLILRLLYDEKQKELLLSRETTITNQEIQEKYIALKIKDRLPAQDEYQKTLKMFEKHSIIELKKGAWNHPDAVIAIYPSIKVALNVQAIEYYSEWLEKETRGDGQVENTDEIEVN